MEMIDPKTVGTRIKELRVAQGITREELASSLGVPVEQVERWESGKDITLAVLRAISKALGVSVDSLFIDVGSSYLSSGFASVMALSDAISFNTGIFRGIPKVVVSQLPNDPVIFKNIMASRVASQGVLISADAVRLASNIEQIGKGLRYIWVVADIDGRPFSLMYEQGWLVEETSRATQSASGVIAGVAAFIF